MSVAPSGLTESTVDVRIVQGKYQPCTGCHWFSVCIVPRGSCMQNINLGPIRDVFKCEEFTSKTPS